MYVGVLCTWPGEYRTQNKKQHHKSPQKRQKIHTISTRIRAQHWKLLKHSIFANVRKILYLFLVSLSDFHKKKKIFTLAHRPRKDDCEKKWFRTRLLVPGRRRVVSADSCRQFVAAAAATGPVLPAAQYTILHTVSHSPSQKSRRISLTRKLHVGGTTAHDGPTYI